MKRKIEIPNQLRNLEFRFFLANGKKPYELGWNKTTNYHFFDDKLLNHINKKGNYGVLGGFGSLIILDFDSWDYYHKVSKKLTHTFTVATANKKTYHLYYYLKGEMIKKIGVDVQGKRVCDIQAQSSGVIGPESTFNNKYYTIMYNQPIATITIQELIRIFNIKPKIHKEYQGTSHIEAPEKVLQALKILEYQKVQRTQERHFKCPFHESQGGQCLYLSSNGDLHCFHCNRHWFDIQDFVDDLKVWRTKSSP